MTGLIDRSLADVRLDTGIQNVERVAVREVLEEVEIGAAIVAQERRLQFQMTPADSSIIVLADRQILAAAVANLVQNALKFTRPGTTMRLGASTSADRVLISVENECGGLPPGKVEDLLRPFTQRDRDRTGLGLGLTICVKAAKRWRASFASAIYPAKGASSHSICPSKPHLQRPFLIISKNSDDGSTGGASGAALHHVDSSSVLLVDDEAALAEEHARNLRRSGRRVEVCTSPVRALERLSAGERSAVVIADCQMPLLSGVELFRRACLTWPGLQRRIIFLSGGPSAEDARFIREHALPFFAKPRARGGKELEEAVRLLLAQVDAA